ncbi:MAG: RNA methyltransferase [Prevotella sp.]|nr:RNA methyltransferase [Prevotella sp.]MBR6191922.1 RNA methyltransferase [Prevotella sp.]
MQKTTILEMNRLTVDEFHEAEKIPLIVVLDDVRSLHNVGSVFRTADAFRVKAIYLCGITATPDDVKDADGTVIKECTLKASQEIHKTALGAEESVSWRYFKTAVEAVDELKKDGFTVLAVEQCHGSTMLQDYLPHSLEGNAGGYAVILGNEVKGVHQEVIDMCDGCLEIPQYGTKHSLNVSVTSGIIIWHFAQHLLLATDDAVK